MAEVENKVQDSQEETPEVTPKDATEPSPTLESGNEGDQVESQEPSDSEDKDSVDWRKRYQDSSREANKLKQAAEEYEKELLSVITESRDAFEKYVDKKGLPPKQKEYWMNIYDTRIAPSKLTQMQSANEEPEDGDTKPAPIQQNQVPENPVRESWMTRMDMQERAKLEAQAKASRDFFEREENRTLPGGVQEAIRATAAMLDAEFNYEPQEALQAARKRILEPEAIQEEGYAEGVRDSLSGGISRGVSGGTAKQKEQVKLPARDEAFVNLEIERKGLKGEAAEEFKRAYAARLALKN